ncbi:glycosyltransferase 61 family protein [Calothrix rhizosoleniae]|uniref:glycosyltransferase 61 family protein n=1 Tax=Calothrix rhizosoleniae TaxID=888997 RepID=UPI000B4A548D|nr:glycosyltransferase family 61 protein [Calothrix rhizosoleniae]
MIETTPLRRLIKRILIGSQDSQEVSEQCSILCPSEKAPSLPAIYLEGQLDKVTGFIEGVNLDIEKNRLAGTMREHSATVAYHIRDALILNGYVYKGAMKYTLVSTPESFFSPKVVDYLPKAALSCTFAGNRFFGHWIGDDLPLNLAAQQLAEPITVVKKPYAHESEYLSLFNLRSRPITQIRCGELIILNDVGQNSFKRQRYELLRSALKNLTPLQPNYGVMIRRGKSGVSRVLTNEDEIAQFLETRGFIIINPEHMPAKEIVHQTLGAKIILGTEGSHIAHGIFTMADHGTIFTLQPPYRFHGIYKDYTDCLDMRYAFVVGNNSPDGFMINLEDLARTLDKIEYLMK